MSTPETRPSKQLEELKSLAGQDATLAYMLQKNRPLTVETYVALAWPDKKLEQLQAEELASIPDPLKSDYRPSEETEEQGMKAEALRRSKVRRVLSAQPAQTPASSK